MAKPRASKNTGFTPTEFISCVLTAEDKVKFTAWQAKPPMSFDDLVNEVLQTGHKMSLSFNDNTDSYICSITGKPEGCDNANKCFTSHAKEYVTAMWVALYKFHVIWGRGVWESMDNATDFG